MQAAQAAKEKMSEPVFSLAAAAAATTKSAGTNPIPQSDAWPGQHGFFKTNPISQLAQNSRLGHQLPTAVLHQGLGPAISNTATGFRDPLYDSHVRPRCTAKERDTETGLDFFGARYFSGPQGRFTSPDPSNLSVDFWLPQTWNRYSYVLNNPLNMADRNGLWPFYIHNEIINEAFPGMSKQDLQILKEASARMDTRPGQQTGGQAPQHGMSNGSSGQTTAQAQQQGDAFIAEQEDLARQIQADWLASGQSGISPYALMAFGNALHTIEDRLSPAHIGSQPWYGQSAWSPSAWAHFLHESYITSFQMGLATSAAQRAFRNTFGFDAFTLMQLQQQQPPPPPKPTVTTKICYTLDNGTQVCQGQ
ncbi:MAG: RHS repeat-associated core domain-containing protein [Bryobacteraceae bacterium]